MAPKKYKEVKFIGGPGLEVGLRCDSSPIGVSTVVESQILNEFISRGWELIEIIKHHSAEKDCTVLMCVIGLPSE